MLRRLATSEIVFQLLLGTTKGLSGVWGGAAHTKSGSKLTALQTLRDLHETDCILDLTGLKNLSRVSCVFDWLS
jgi:hypothetical protein